MVARGAVICERYRLLDVLGDGATAWVFRAEDERLGRVVAVKILHQRYLSRPGVARRFEWEARRAASLSHPDIVAVYDGGRDGETHVMVMEYVGGDASDRLIARAAPLPLARVVPIMEGLGTALDAAHAHGIVHHDIKPDTILLTPTGQVKVRG